MWIMWSISRVCWLGTAVRFLLASHVSRPSRLAPIADLDMLILRPYLVHQSLADLGLHLGNCTIRHLGGDWYGVLAREF